MPAKQKKKSKKVIYPKPKKVNFSKVLFRASSFHSLMGGIKEITPKQLAEIDRLVEKNKKKPLAKTDTNTLARLVALRDDPIELSTGALTYLHDLYVSLKWNRRVPLKNDYLEKGNFNEDEAIAMVSRLHGEFYENNKDRVNDKFFTGEADIREGIDTKCSWWLKTFPKAEDPLPKVYEFQNRVYMRLYNKDKWSTIYCLLDMPRHMIKGMISKEHYNPEFINDEGEAFVPDWRVMEILNLYVYTEKTLQKYVRYFDIDFEKDEKAKQIMLDFVEIPESKRSIKKTVYRDKKIEKRMVDVAKLSRKELIRLDNLK